MFKLANIIENPFKRLSSDMRELEESELKRAQLAEVLGAVSTRPVVEPFRRGDIATVILFPSRPVSLEEQRKPLESDALNNEIY